MTTIIDPAATADGPAPSTSIDHAEPGPVPPVAFLDLAALHRPLRADLDALWAETVDRSAFVGGDRVTEFETQWAAYCQRNHAVGVANGTDALELVLAALEIGPGDEVIVPTNTFVATAEAVVTVGATPVFVDVDETTLLVTADQVAAAVTERTRAVMVVHLYGQVPDMGRITAVADLAGIDIIEDAAQAHGARWRGDIAGSFGVAATFSFYPGKNLGALGDGGAVVTDDDALAERVRTLANHGRGHHLLHSISGRNSRLDGLQAGALAIKLDHLDRWNDRRRSVHRRYVAGFAGTDVQVLGTLDGGEPVHHLEVVRVADRDGVRQRLTEAGIASGIHYAHPCHQQPAFAEFARRPLPIAERAAETQLSLPMHPTLTDHEVDRVIATVIGAT